MTTEQKTETKSITAILEVPTETYDWLKEKADAQGVDIGQVIADLIAENAPSPPEKTIAPSIEYENVTIKVPKLIMDFLRKTEDNPINWLEYTIVENVSAEIESMRPQRWADLFQLTPVFKKILGDLYKD
jgi:hypothetical protein